MKKLLYVLLCSSACGSAGAALPDAFDVHVEAVTVSPATVLTKRGLDMPTQLALVAALNNSKSVDVTSEATWTSSDETVAKVSASGLVTAIGVGVATITASYDGVMANATFTTAAPRIYMTEAGGAPGITMFDAYAIGDTPPLARITGAATTLSFPWADFVANDEIYVSDNSMSAIDVWPITATGNVAPSRRIVGALTKLQVNYGLAVYNHEIYVAAMNEILVFPDTASGNVAPSREIIGATTGLSSSGYGLTIDHDEIYVTNSSTNSILVFPVTASGDVAPTRQLTGIPGLGFSVTYGLQVSNGELYVADLTGVRTYLSSTTGLATPIRYLHGTDTGLGTVIGVNIVGSELYSVNYSTGGIHVHPLKATGDAAPTRIISGGMTTISSPRYQFVY